jgi:preprotein translocase subunit YajC
MSSMKVQYKVLIIGGVTGALIGLGAAFLYIKANEGRIAAIDAGEVDALAKVKPGEALSIGMAVIGLLRQIVGMGKS